jgi:iron(III) transport system permease protein
LKTDLRFRLALGLVFGFLGLFLIYPVLYVVKGSVYVEQGGQKQFSLIFFELFAGSPFMWRCLGNSFVLSVLTTFLSAILAMPLAFVFVRYQFPMKTLWRTLLMAPLILPPFVGAIGLQQLFGRFGTVNHLLGFVGPGVAQPNPVDWFGVGGFWGIIVIQSLHLFPIFFLNVSSSLANIHPSVHEAAASLGAPARHIFRTVTLPLLKPGLFSSGVIVFMWAFTDLGTPLIFEKNDMVAVQIFDRAKETGFNPFGYTLVLVVLFLTIGLFFISRRWLHQQDYMTQSRVEVEEDLVSVRGLRGFLLFGGMGLFCFLTLLPHLSVVLQSLSGRWFLSALPQEWTLEHYGEIVSLEQTRRGLLNSCWFSLGSAGLDVVLGVVIAYWLARRQFRGKGVLDVLTVLPLALPGIVLAFGYVVGFNVPSSWWGWDLTWLKLLVNPRDNPTLLLVISYSVRRLPYMVRSVYSGLQQIHVSMEEASRNLGASRLQTLVRIVLPLLKGHLIAGGLLVFAFAFLEVSDSLILAMKEQFYPVTKVMWALMGRIEPGSASIASALGAIGMGLLLLVFYVAYVVLGKRLGNLFR